MEYRLEIIGEFISELFSLFVLVGLIFIIFPLFKSIVFALDVFYSKNVQKKEKHSIIDMSQGGRYDKRINQQRSPGRKRGL